ncbi:GumC family protein [Candidatus Laterigemmans baculatus]|uniref:GumC family protein n=1 Tax=Candidatus Laterigemmans baculatus TaxID=2770505 RepID=UPI0013DAAC46|nr:hypothetical protein [Candidatus Laterigemmans baculatus]
MTTNQPIPWKYLGQTLRRFAPVWAGAALLFAGFGIAYTITRNDTWEASQPLLIRDEATGSADRLGRFASQTDLIAAQETILEMARNREVVAAALRDIGPPAGADASRWPTASQVESAASEAINVRPAKGAEFGDTEVVYLVAQGETPERAARLCAAVFARLSEHLRTVRRVRADSIIDELSQARDLARTNLETANAELQKLETTVGSDLGELRGLSESVTGEGNTSRVLSEVQRELDVAELELERVETLRELLVRSSENPQHLLVAGSELLSTQPTLQRIKEGLIDAQLAASQLSGRYTADHPRMRSAVLEQQTIREELRQEIDSATAAMKPTLDLAREKVARLTGKRDRLRDKLARLATLRTEYGRMTAEVRHRTELLAQAQTGLAEAEATRSAAMTTNLIAGLAPPRVGERPIGPGGTTIVGGAMVAGLLFGLGTVFLVAPGPQNRSYGRRWSDYLGGRRASDRLPAATSGGPTAAASMPGFPTPPGHSTPVPERRAAAAGSSRA